MKTTHLYKQTCDLLTIDFMSFDHVKANVRPISYEPAIYEVNIWVPETADFDLLEADGWVYHIARSTSTTSVDTHPSTPVLNRFSDLESEEWETDSDSDWETCSSSEDEENSVPPPSPVTGVRPQNPDFELKQYLTSTIDHIEKMNNYVLGYSDDDESELDESIPSDLPPKSVLSHLRSFIKECRRRLSIPTSRFPITLTRTLRVRSELYKIIDLHSAELADCDNAEAGVENQLISLFKGKFDGVHPRPIECVTATASLISWLTLMFRYSKSPHDLGGIGITALVGLGVGIFSELYHLISDIDTSFSIDCPSFDEMIGAVRDKFYSIFDIPQSKGSLSVRCASAVGFLLCKMFKINTKEFLDFSGFLRGASELEDMMDSLLWHFAEIDMTGKHMLEAQAQALEIEGKTLIDIPTEQFWGPRIDEATRWTDQVSNICRAINKADYPLLLGLLTRMQLKISEAKAAEYGANTIRPAPVVVFLYGPPAQGKSFYCSKYLIPYLAKRAGDVDPRVYNLNTGKHASRYSGQLWATFDEFGASNKPGESFVQDNLNNICSGLHAPIPGASIDEKHQSAAFSGVFFLSNLSQANIDIGLRGAAKEAFFSRAIIAQVELRDYVWTRNREDQTRAVDFSDLIFTTPTADGYTYRNGPQFAAYVGNVLRAKQAAFLRGQQVQIPDIQSDFTLHRPVNLLQNPNPQPAPEPVDANGVFVPAPPPAQPVVPQPVVPEPDAGPQPPVEIEVGPVPNHDALQANHDVPQTIAPRTLWVYGSPGNGKTTQIIPMIKDFGNRTSTTVLKGHYNMRVPSKPSIIVLDDVVDPTNKAGQDEFSSFYNRVIFPSSSTLVVFSNYGPHYSITNSVKQPFKALKQMWDGTSCKVLNPAFGRRSGFYPSESTRVIVVGSTCNCMDFYTREVDDTRVMIYSSLFGVGTMNPVRIDYGTITDIPFTETEADLWIDLEENDTPEVIVRKFLASCALRIYPCGRFLSDITTPDISRIIGIYRESLKIVPDIKLRVKRAGCLIVANGPRVIIDQNAILPDLITRGNSVDMVAGNTTLAIDKKTFLAFISNDASAKKPIEVRTIAEITRFSNLDSTFLGKVGAQLGVTAAEYQRASEARSSSILKNVTAGLVGMGFLGFIIWGIKKFVFDDDSTKEFYETDNSSSKVPCNDCMAKFKVDMPEGKKKAALKKITRVRNHGGQTWQYEDELPAQMEKDWFNFQAHIFQNPIEDIYEQGGQKFARCKFNSGGRQIFAHVNLSGGSVEFDHRDRDTPQMANLEGVSLFKNKGTSKLVEILKGNIVTMRDDFGTGYCYGTMMDERIGVTVRHVWDDLPTQIGYEYKGKLCHKRITKIQDYPDYELVFFRITDVDPGPFKNISRYIANLDDLANSNMASMICVADNQTHIMSCPYQVEATITNRFSIKSLQHWKTNIGYIYYGASTSPTTNGSCGLPSFVEINNTPYLAGIHVADRMNSMKLASALITSEVWSHVSEDIKKIPNLTKGDKSESKGYVKDPSFHSDHPDCLPPLVPFEIVEKVGPTDWENDFQPHGPGLKNIGHMSCGGPSDTKGTKYDIPLNNVLPPFPNVKVPTITEKEILERYPDRLTKDARGVNVVAYARLKAAENNVYRRKNMMSEKEALAFADAFYSEKGLDTKRIEPLSIQEAVAGNKFVQPIKRDASNGGVLDSLFRTKGKGTIINYDDTTREVIYPSGPLVKKWLEDQYSYAKKGIRIQIPGSLGLKSETLKEEKLHKKRVFCITDTITGINQKRFLLPIQNLICSSGSDSRFTLTFDPVMGAHDWVNNFAEKGCKFVGFDWSSFDMTIPAQIIMTAAIVLGHAYTFGRDEDPTPLLTGVKTTLNNMTFSSALLDKALILFMGGLRSGANCTSLLCSICCILVIYLDFSRHVFKGMTPVEFHDKIKSRHGGDDLTICVAADLAVKIDLEAVCKRIFENYGMTLTVDVKTDDVPVWSEFTDISFLSRTFLEHPDHPGVWISKLKPESVASQLYYSESKLPAIHMQAVENAAYEVFPHGKEIYNKYRYYAYYLSEQHGIPIEVPSYSQISHEFWNAIISKEDSKTVHERQPVYEAKRHKLQPLSSNMPLSNSYTSIRSRFVDALTTSKTFASLRSSRAYVEYLEASHDKLMTHQVLNLGEAKCAIFPRNAPMFWWFVELCTKYHNEGSTGALIDKSDYDRAVYIYGKNVHEEWDQYFTDYKLEAGKDTPPEYLSSSKKDKFRLHVIPYLFLNEPDNPDLWPKIKIWALLAVNPLDAVQGKVTASTPGPANNNGMKPHYHVCFACNRPYGHYHKYSKVDHRQFTGQCPYKGCDQFGIDHTRGFMTLGDVVQSDPQGGVVPISTGDSAPKMASGTGTGNASQQFAADMNAALVSSTDVPPAITGGSGSSAPRVMESLGGYTPETFPRGAFLNTILAPCYAPCPLETIDVGMDTVENTVLKRYTVNPWNPAFAGPYITEWANSHQRFVGSFQVGINVASAGTILGKIGVYYIPGDCVLPEVPTRQTLFPFEHVMIDLQVPSSESILVRPSNRTDFYLSRDDTENRGQIIVIAFTSIQNTYGAAVIPPVYCTIMLGEDAMFSLPTMSVAPPEGALKNRALPPVPRLDEGVYFFTDGKNLPIDPVDNGGLPLTQNGSNYTANHAITSGVMRVVGMPQQTTQENQLSFRWGVWQSPVWTNYTDQIGAQFPGNYMEGISRHYTPGYSVEDPIDTVVTLGQPWDYDRSFPAPGGSPALYNGYTDKVSLVTNLVLDTAKYDVRGIAPNNGSAPLMYMRSPTYGDKRIKPVLNTDVGTFTHTKLRANVGGGTVDRFKVTVPDCNISVEENSNCGGELVVHNMVYNRFQAEFSSVCTQSFPTSGGNIPPGYKLMMWYERNSDTFPFGVSGVLPGVGGPTHAPAPGWTSFMDQCRAYISSTGIKSFVIKGATYNGQTVMYLLANNLGLWAYGIPDYALAVSSQTAFNWFLERVHEEDEWPLLRASTGLIFKSRVVLPDVAQSMSGAAVGAVGGLLGGLGGAMDSYQNQKYTLQQIRAKGKIQQEMQKQSLINSRILTDKQTRAQIGAAVQYGQNMVDATNARVAGMNPVRGMAANQGASPAAHNGAVA